MGTHIPAEWMVLCRGVDLRAEAHVLLERSSEIGGACFKELGPVIFASGGVGTDFTLNSMLATFRPDLCTFPQPTVSTALAERPRWAGTAFLHMRLVLDRIRSPGKYRRRVRAVESFFFFAHLCWFEANVGPEAVFGTITHLFQFSLADTEQYFVRHPPTLINWWPSWRISFDAVRVPSCSLRFV